MIDWSWLQLIQKRFCAWTSPWSASALVPDLSPTTVRAHSLALCSIKELKLATSTGFKIISQSSRRWAGGKACPQYFQDSDRRCKLGVSPDRPSQKHWSTPKPRCSPLSAQLPAGKPWPLTVHHIGWACTQFHGFHTHLLPHHIQ